MVDLERLRELLDAGDFEGLLIGTLGWDNPPEGAHEVNHEEDRTTARLVAIKRGVGVWTVDGIPSRPAQRRLDALVAKQTRERLLVFVEAGRQVWLWPEQRPSGAGYRLVAHEHFTGTRNEALVQRLAGAAFTIDEEADLTVMDVLERVRRSFDAEKVTKRFYSEFKAQKEGLLDQIEGIEDPDEVAWYGSILLNRLMLVYFLQRKGFLDDDYNYLKHRLEMVREHLGEDAFYGFFKDFVLPLFHDGLGSHLQDYDDPAISEIVGDVPYINGGIFFEHSLESANDIDIPDSAFEAIFAFFDQFRWHLDERPTDDPNEISPDVLGYVFEQYVNSKEMGAYYTKEDVTGYMTTVTLLPAFLDRLNLADGEPWVLLAADPDRYIYDSVRHGAEIPLPAKIETGLDDEDERDDWWEKATPDLGLPGENWWEVVDRRRRYMGLKESLAEGEVGDVSACITENLDIRTLVTDYLDQLPDIESGEQAYERLSEITVLDPTCGSGAFLLAALEILADLYMALIERAQELVDAGSGMPGFLEEAQRHPNLRYFVLRSAQLNNLYGVDIMAEAGEIARLRLFLKLAAQLEHRDQVEPFPDLDLNIKCGNLLVGIADQEDAERRFSSSILASAVFDRIAGAVEESAEMFGAFVVAQARSDAPEVIRGLKEALQERTDGLRTEVDRMLHDMRTEPELLEDWVASHQPFHWFLEFPKVFQRGGFDVVVGNPPYVSVQTIESYQWFGYRHQDVRNVYALCLERCIALGSHDFCMSMVTPLSLAFSEGFAATRALLMEELESTWSSTYGTRPASLFSGVQVRCTIFTGISSDQRSHCASTHRIWLREQRKSLFQTLYFLEHPRELAEIRWHKIADREMLRLLAAMNMLPPLNGQVSGLTENFLYYKPVARYWLPVSFDQPASVLSDGSPLASPNVNSIRIDTPENCRIAISVMAGALGYFWWSTNGDDLNVPPWIIKTFPIPVFTAEERREVLMLSDELETRLSSEIFWTKNAGQWVSNYDLAACRAITDRIDEVYLDAIGMRDCQSALKAWYWTVMKSTGDPTGSLRGPVPPPQRR